MILNRQMARLQSWSFRDVKYPFIAHYFQVHSRVVELDRVPSISQIELFDI